MAQDPRRRGPGRNPGGQARPPGPECRRCRERTAPAGEREARGRARPHQDRPGNRGKSTRALGTALRERGLRKEAEEVTRRRTQRPGSGFPEIIRMPDPRDIPGNAPPPGKPGRRRKGERRRGPAGAAPCRPVGSRSGSRSWTSSTATGSPTSPRPRPGPSCSTRAPTTAVSAPCTGSWPPGTRSANGAPRPPHPPRVRPELVADGPDQVWTWDITKLKSQWRGLYFDLYVMIDIFSRKVDPLGSPRHREPATSRKHSSRTRSSPTAAPARTTSTPTTAPR